MIASRSVGYEIRESVMPENGVALQLVVEGSPVARATASGTVLSDMSALLGLERDAVVSDLRKSLVDLLKTQGQFVEIANLQEDRGQRLRFSARFTHRLRDEVSTGVVWYDVSTSTTGPNDVPAVVRNRMRFEVHRKLTGDGTAARALVDLHR